MNENQATLLFRSDYDYLDGCCVVAQLVKMELMDDIGDLM